MSGGKIKSWMLPCPGGYPDLEALEKYLKENPVKLVATVHCANVLGTLFPAEKIADLCHKYGAQYCLDTA